MSFSYAVTEGIVKVRGGGALGAVDYAGDVGSFRGAAFGYNVTKVGQRQAAHLNSPSMH